VSTCCGKEEEAPIQEADAFLKTRLVFQRLLVFIEQSHNYISDYMSKGKTHMSYSGERWWWNNILRCNLILKSSPFPSLF